MFHRSDPGWVGDVSVVAGLVHNWLIVSDLGGPKVEWFIANHGEENFTPYEPQSLFDFLDQSIEALLKIALQICMFFSIEQTCIKSAFNAYGNLSKQTYISEHTKKGSHFALFLYFLLRYAHKVNNIDWPERRGYKCNISKASKKAMLDLRNQYANLPFVFGKTELSSSNVRQVKLYRKPTRIFKLTFTPDLSLPNNVRYYEGTGDCRGFFDTLTLTAHRAKPLKRPAEPEQHQRYSYMNPQTFADFKDQLRRDALNDANEQRWHYFSGSFRTDKQILEFLTPAEITRIKDTSPYIRELIKEIFRVPLQWASKIDNEVSWFFRSKCGKQHLYLNSWDQNEHQVSLDNSLDALIGR